MKKKVMVINRHPPCGTANNPDALDLLLAYSVFEHEVSMVFIDDGVFQLKSNQDTTLLQQKNFTAALEALDIYDVKNVYVEQESLQQRGLTPQHLMGQFTVLSSKNLAQHMAEQDLIINF